MTRFFTGALACTLLLSGCGRDELTGPPSLRLGRDMCEACGMLVNEDRCSSGLLVDRDGRRNHLLFDDIGCMIDYERGMGNQLHVLSRYLHDHATKAWVLDEQAHFVLADDRQLRTPMSSGIIAFAHPASAGEAAERYAGRTVTYAELQQLRARQAEERRSER